MFVNRVLRILQKSFSFAHPLIVAGGSREILILSQNLLCHTRTRSVVFSNDVSHFAGCSKIVIYRLFYDLISFICTAKCFQLSRFFRVLLIRIDENRLHELVSLCIVTHEQSGVMRCGI